MVVQAERLQEISEASRPLSQQTSESLYKKAENELLIFLLSVSPLTLLSPCGIVILLSKWRSALVSSSLQQSDVGEIHQSMFSKEKEFEDSFFPHSFWNKSGSISHSFIVLNFNRDSRWAYSQRRKITFLYLYHYYYNKYYCELINISKASKSLRHFNR